MTKQEVFDLVVQKLREQGEPSIALNSAGDAICRYRGPNGLKCAVGHLIPDESYSSAMEGLSAGIIDLPKELEPHVSLLVQLQEAHDSSVYYGDDWLDEFNYNAKLIANEEGLKYVQP